MKLVVFAGAGFSVPFGLPTMDAFLGFADASTRLDREDKELLGLLILEARRANSFLESSPTNLEDILSFSEMGERLALSPREENRSDRLRRIVQRVFTTAVAPEQYWSRYASVQRLLGKKPHDSDVDVSFITTNYDLNIEAACAHAGWYSDPGFEIQRGEIGSVSVDQGMYHPRAVPLYKLHGSVNWYPHVESPSGLLVEDRVVRMTGGGSLPYICARDYVAPSTPLIVPPSFLKPEMSPALKGAWIGAAKALAQASVVAFLGYSFPPSDTEMMYFLARALSENPALRRIWIIDPSAKAIVARLQNPLSKTGSHFRDLIKPVESKWESLNQSIQELR